LEQDESCAVSLLFNVSWGQLGVNVSFEILDLLVYLEDKDYGFTIPVTSSQRSTNSTWTIVGGPGLTFF